jgi:hypothetical protein
MRSPLRSPAVWPATGALIFVVSISASNAPTALGVKGRGNATPTIAADGSFVAVAWGGAEPSGVTDVFASVSRDGGRTFTPLNEGLETAVLPLSRILPAGPPGRLLVSGQAIFIGRFP